MELLISQPELPLQVPKPVFVFLPISIDSEVFLSISSPLEHDSLSIVHVTVDLEGLHTSRVDSVDSILSTSSLIDLLTITRYGVSRVTCSNDQNPSSSNQCLSHEDINLIIFCFDVKILNLLILHCPNFIGFKFGSFTL